MRYEVGRYPRAILFNWIIDIVLLSLKSKLGHHGLFIGPGLERLSNTRYADDILLYMSTLDEFLQMTELLIDELKVVGLQLNYKKTKILYIHDAKEFNDIDYVEV